MVKAGQVRKPASHSSGSSQTQPPAKVLGVGEGRGGRGSSCRLLVQVGGGAFVVGVPSELCVEVPHVRMSQTPTVLSLYMCLAMWVLLLKEQ